MFELKFVWFCNTYGQQPIVVKRATYTTHAAVVKDHEEGIGGFS